MKVGRFLNLTDFLSRGGARAETFTFQGLPRTLGGGGGTKGGGHHLRGG